MKPPAPGYYWVFSKEFPHWDVMLIDAKGVAYVCGDERSVLDFNDPDEAKAVLLGPKINFPPEIAS